MPTRSSSSPAPTSPRACATSSPRRRRLSGDDNASPVINLQTNFGGGKTHSMLALWHLAAGRPLSDFPQELQDLLAGRIPGCPPVRRVAAGRYRLSPPGSGQAGRHQGQHDLGRAGLAARRPLRPTRSSPRPTATAPSRRQPCASLLRHYAPAASSSTSGSPTPAAVGRDDLPGGTFDDPFHLRAGADRGGQGRVRGAAGHLHPR